MTNIWWDCDLVRARWLHAGFGKWFRFRGHAPCTQMLTGWRHLGSFLVLSPEISTIWNHTRLFNGIRTANESRLNLLHAYLRSAEFKTSSSTHPSANSSSKLAILHGSIESRRQVPSGKVPLHCLHSWKQWHCGLRHCPRIRRSKGINPAIFSKQAKWEGIQGEESRFVCCSWSVHSGMSSQTSPSLCPTLRRFQK